VGVFTQKLRTSTASKRGCPVPENSPLPSAGGVAAQGRIASSWPCRPQDTAGWGAQAARAKPILEDARTQNQVSGIPGNRLPSYNLSKMDLMP